MRNTMGQAKVQESHCLLLGLLMFGYQGKEMFHHQRLLIQFVLLPRLGLVAPLSTPRHTKQATGLCQRLQSKVLEIHAFSERLV